MNGNVQLDVIYWKEAPKKKNPGRPEPLPADDEILIAGETIPVDYVWRGKDVKEFIRMWNAGLSLMDIAEKGWPDRNPDDILDLWRHCLYMEWIQDRPGGIYGRRYRLKEDEVEILVRKDDNKKWRVAVIQYLFGRRLIAYLPEKFKIREEAEQYAAQLQKERDGRRRLA